MAKRPDLSALELGYAADATTVTVYGAEPPHNVNDHESLSGEGLLQMIAGTLAQRVEAAEARAAAAEKKSSSLSADFDAEDVERRVKRIERRLKSLDEEK